MAHVALQSVGKMNPLGLWKGMQPPKAKPPRFISTMMQERLASQSMVMISFLLGTRGLSNGLSQSSIKHTRANASGWDQMKMRGDASEF